MGSVGEENLKHFPEHAKLLALELPSRTIGGFLHWLREAYGHIDLRGDTDHVILALIYEHYGVDPGLLAEEAKEMEALRAQAALVADEESYGP